MAACSSSAEKCLLCGHVFQGSFVTFVWRNFGQWLGFQVSYYFCGNGLIKVLPLAHSSNVQSHCLQEYCGKISEGFCFLTIWFFFKTVLTCVHFVWDQSSLYGQRVFGSPQALLAPIHSSPWVPSVQMHLAPCFLTLKLYLFRVASEMLLLYNSPFVSFLWKSLSQNLPLLANTLL